MRVTPIVPILVWFGTGVALLLVLALTDNYLLAVTWFPVAALAYSVTAIVLLVRYVRNAIKQRSGTSWVAAASIPLLLVALLLSEPTIARLAIYSEFAVMLPKYSTVVTAVTGTPPHRAAGEVEYIVDEGPPVRIAFPQGGILDNWHGIVFDPSDAVAQATGWNHDGGTVQFTAPPGIREVFGGDLVSCRHLQGHYYSCSFT